MARLSEATSSEVSVSSVPVTAEAPVMQISACSVLMKLSPGSPARWRCPGRTVPPGRMVRQDLMSAAKSAICRLLVTTVNGRSRSAAARTASITVEELSKMTLSPALSRSAASRPIATFSAC
ncbi:hypothetical protein D3C72_1712830 [compost metagenome]